jgi:hypothetical protein
LSEITNLVGGIKVATNLKNTAFNLTVFFYETRAEKLPVAYGVCGPKYRGARVGEERTPSASAQVERDAGYGFGARHPQKIQLV